jgi:F-type H+-transporting ATPase subunit delta
MSGERVARVYAQALFDAAEAADVAAAVGRELGDFVTGLAASAALRHVLTDPQVDTAAKARVLAGVTQGATPLVANVLQLLLERGRFEIVEDVRAQYDVLEAAQADLVRVDVQSAVELSAAAREKIGARVQELTGRRVELSSSVDAALLGGLVMRVGDVVVDGSVRGRIDQLRRRLATAHVRGDVE